MNERLLLSSINHSFIANIHSAFQDRINLYLVMDLLNGGDYFAVGVIAFELMNRRRPYNGRSRKEIKDAILSK